MYNLLGQLATATRTNSFEVGPAPGIATARYSYDGAAHKSPGLIVKNCRFSPALARVVRQPCAIYPTQVDAAHARSRRFKESRSIRTHRYRSM